MMATTVSETDPAALVITLFGPIQVLVNGQSLPRLRSRKSLWLLALLTLRHGRPVEREWLAGMLWPDADQEQAFANLRVVLSELRKGLGAQGGRLQSPDRHTVSLDLTGAQADAPAFDTAIASGTLPALVQAVALYTGTLLEGCTEEWAPQERRAREEDCLRALGTLGEAALVSGDSAAAVGHYRRAVVLDPWRESARRGLMEALARGGDTNAALGVYREFTELLRSDPKAVPDEQTSALYARLRAGLRQRAAAPVSAPVAVLAPAISGSLPHALTDLVGREDERLEVTAKLRRSRLVTLTGPGGIGKTRLAVEVAADAAPGFADGVWLVALESLADSGQVAARIAGVLGLKEEPGRSALDTLTERLRRERALLVLDNCEHLLAACAQVAEHLLRECAGVRILATSREVLGIRGETAWAVPGLSVPDPAHLPVNPATRVRVLAGYEGVQLFVERAQAVQKTFALTGDNGLAVAQVCARLEGIPLAIELAAARVKVLTVAQIAARLDDRRGLLTGESRAGPSRQQTLRATLDWSHSLLSVPEQLLLARLSVFAAGWTLEAIEAVCADDGIAAGQVLDLLTGLVDKSLAVFEAQAGSGLTDGTGAGRYRLLEMVRQYAGQHLSASGKAARIGARHRDYFLALAEEAEPQLKGADQRAWLGRLEAEHDNLRAALSWCESDPQGALAGLRLTGALSRFWIVRGHGREGRQSLERALARADAQAGTAARVKALAAAGLLAYHEGDLGPAQALYEEGLHISRERGDRAETAQVLSAMSRLALSRAEYTVARALLEESLHIFREFGDKSGAAQTLSTLGNIHFDQGEFGLARTYFEESLRLTEEAGDRRSAAWMQCYLGTVASAQQDYIAARVYFDESLGFFEETEDRANISMVMKYLGTLAGRQGDYRQAQEWLEKSVGIYRELGDRRPLAWALMNLGSILQELGEYAAASEMGQEGFEIFEAIGDRRGMAGSWLALAALASAVGDLARAQILYAQGLSLGLVLEEKLVVASALEGLAGVLLGLRRPQKSVCLWGAAETLRESIGAPLPLAEQAGYARQREQARASLGDAAFMAAWEEGCALTWEQAVAYALEEA